MGSNLAFHLFSLIEELDVIEFKHVGIKSGSLASGHKTCLHLTIEAVTEQRSIDSLDTHDTRVGSQSYFRPTLGEVVERRSEDGSSVLHAIGNLQQTATELITQAVLGSLTFLVDQYLHAILLWIVGRSIVDGGLLCATVLGRCLEYILAGNVHVLHMTSSGIQCDIRTLGLAYHAPCHRQIVIVLQVKSVLTATHIGARCNIEGAMMRCKLGSHADESVVDAGSTNCQSNSFELNLDSRKVCWSSHYEFAIFISFKYSKPQNGTRNRIFAYLRILFIVKREINM